MALNSNKGPAVKAITEFPTHILTKGIQAREALTTEGKTPEEISASIGETFKYEGDKLKCFVTALDVAAQNMEKLTRIRIIKFNDGETIPPKSTKIEDFHYVPEFAQPPGTAMKEKPAMKQGGKGGKDRKGPKSSPWGPSPEELAAKKEASEKSKKAAKA
jgi:hypothetical protein